MAVRRIRIDRRLLKPWILPRDVDSNKGDFGHVLAAAGSRGMMGAARLCALGALRSGAGLVTMAVPESEYGTAVPWEVMTLPLLSTDGVFSARAVQGVLDFVRARRVSAVALGPGLSTKPGAARFALTLLESLTVPVVADADALNALSSSGLRPRRKAPWILTPHPGEAGRLLRSTSKAVQADRPAAAAALAARFGAVAVLKGARTIVTDGSTIYENSTGNPGMASGGMGDVLTGMIAALVGQVMASTPREACLRAAVLGVYLHGRAGDLALRELGPVGITASDLANRVPAALKEIL